MCFKTFLSRVKTFLRWLFPCFECDGKVWPCGDDDHEKAQNFEFVRYGNFYQTKSDNLRRSRILQASIFFVNKISGDVNQNCSTLESSNKYIRHRNVAGRSATF